MWLLSLVEHLQSCHLNPQPRSIGVERKLQKKPQEPPKTVDTEMETADQNGTLWWRWSGCYSQTLRRSGARVEFGAESLISFGLQNRKGLIISADKEIRDMRTHPIVIGKSEQMGQRCSRPSIVLPSVDSRLAESVNGATSQYRLVVRLARQKKMHYPFSKECPLQLGKYIRVL